MLCLENASLLNISIEVSKEKLWFGWLEWLVFLIVMGCLHYKNKKKEGLSLQNNVSHQCSQLKVQVTYATEMAIFF